MKPYIIIVNYKKYQDTINCLRGIFRFLPKKFQNIILVDNESGSEVREIARKFSRILIIKNSENLGFSKAINQGVGEALQSRASHVLLLNNDTVTDSDFISPLFSSKYDLVSPILKFKREGEWWYDLGGKINWVIGRPYHINIKNQKSLTGQAKIKNTYQNLKIDYISGCAMLVKRKVFEKIGLFDERYFLYFEDVDFCLRAKKAGYRIGVESKSLVTHLLEEKNNQTRLFKLKQLLKSQVLFINKWVPIYSKPLSYLYYWWLKGKVVLISPRRSQDRCLATSEV